MRIEGGRGMGGREGGGNEVGGRGTKREDRRVKKNGRGNLLS